MSRAGAPRALDRAALERRASAASLATLGFAGLLDAARACSHASAPTQAAALDPRLDLPIVFNEARASRPVSARELCPVCDDLTCGAVDIAPLPDDDVAYLAPNLYPIAYPQDATSAAGARRDGSAPTPHGVHLVHWSSLRHDRGLPDADAHLAPALWTQLAAAEEWLLHSADASFPETGDGHRGHVGIVKNVGRAVGGSVEHDHQQVMLCAARPAEPALTRGLRARLLAHTSEALVVECVDGRASTLCAPFMRRPLHTFVAPHGDDRGHLHHLDAPTLAALAVAVARLLHAITAAMRAGGQEPAYNLICHSGPGLGPLVEVRPYTQPLGGYEHWGLYLCEERPETSARRLREVLGG